MKWTFAFSLFLATIPGLSALPPDGGNTTDEKMRVLNGPEPPQVKALFGEIDKRIGAIASRYPQLKSWKRINKKKDPYLDGKMVVPFQMVYRQGLRMGFLPDYRPYQARNYCSITLLVSNEAEIAQIYQPGAEDQMLVRIQPGNYAVYAAVSIENPKDHDLVSEILRLIRSAAEAVSAKSP